MDFSNAFPNIKPALDRKKPEFAPFVAAVLTGVLLFITRLKGPAGILLFDRFLPGLGWLQITLISSYAALISHYLLKGENTGFVRLFIWRIFSIVFFSQLILGIFVSKTFLMSGTLHIPVPALILAGPIYGGKGFFMPILFTSTVILTGPAWCSYLCYFGAWDGVAASKKEKPAPYGNIWKILRISVFISVIVLSLSLRFLHVSTAFAAGTAIGFGVIGIILMITVSRRRGFMAHCTSFCPIGILSNILGKISPFRIIIDSNCLYCMKCTEACRYNALKFEDMESGKAGLTCTLCGDCISTCSRNSINYHFPGLSAGKSRTLFISLISVIHAVFLGIARI